MKKLSRVRQWLCVSLFAIALLFVNRDHLADWLDLEPSPPSAAIEQLAQATHMTRSAQRLFYRQNPIIASQADFLKQCRVPDRGIMLGCYIRRGHQGKIVIQQVDDPRLKGMMEVTAAHEMLHAAYEAVNPQTRSRLTAPLYNTAKQVKEKRLASVLKGYKEKSAELYRNELHSHIGTEIIQLNPELEHYYQRYFTDRQQVVTLAQQSSSSFRQLDAQAEALKPEIDQLEATLKQKEAKLTQAEAAIKRSHQTLNRLDRQLQQTKQQAETAFRQGAPDAYQLAAQFEQQKGEFNRNVDVHNAQARQHKQNITDFNAQVRTYKTKIKQYNQISRESRTILESLKAKPTEP